jgi:hypothetical protein
MTIDLRHVGHLSLVWKGASPSGRAPAESQSSGLPDARTVVGVFVTEPSFDEVAAIGLSVGAPGSVATGLAAPRASARDSAANGLAGARQRAKAFTRGGSTVSGGGGGSASALAVRTGGTRSSFSSSDDRVRTTSTFRGVKVEASSGERAFGLAVAVGAGGVGAAGAMGVTLATVMTEAWGHHGVAVSGGSFNVDIDDDDAHIGSGRAGSGGGVGIDATGAQPVNGIAFAGAGGANPGPGGIGGDHRQHQGAAVGGTASILQAPGDIPVSRREWGRPFTRWGQALASGEIAATEGGRHRGTDRRAGDHLQRDRGPA